MVAQFDREQDYAEQLAKRQKRDLALERQREIQKQFLLEQVDELAADFVDHPEQIGYYIADLESAGMLGVADKGMLFRRLWETMGPSFADRAFSMTEQAIASSEVLAADIANDVEAELDARSADRMLADGNAAARVNQAASILTSLARALGLDLDVAPPPEVAPPADVRIKDSDRARAAKTRELLDELAPQLGVDRDVEVRVDREAQRKTADQGLFGLMSEGTVFLNADVYEPETQSGRALLAHEVTHIAQRENMLRGALSAAPSLMNAEREADVISQQFGAGNAVEAPLASLGAYDQAACGPRAMQQPDPDPDIDPDPDPIYPIIDDIIQVPEIHFDFDKSDIRPQDAEILRGLINTLNAHPEIKRLLIESHTDAVGSDEYNQALSQRRAASTKKWLVENGSPIPLDSIGYGESRLRVDTQARSEENRRSVFRITERADNLVQDDEGNWVVLGGNAQANSANGGGGGGGGGGGAGGGGGGGAGGQTTTDTWSADTTKDHRARSRRFAGNSLRTAAQPGVNQVNLPAQPKAAPGGLKAETLSRKSQARGGGEKLPGDVLSRFESAFDHDFSDVRVHRGSAQAMSIGATAFARGTDIHFAPGRYDTSSKSGMAVLGHELTHIVQQRAGRVSIPQGKGTHINAERSLEAEADLLGARAARGERVHVTGSSAGLMRKATNGSGDAIQFEGGTAAAATGDSGGSAPERVEVTLAGRTIRAEMPSNASAGGEVRVDWSDADTHFAGLTLTTSRITLNEGYEVESGTINGHLTIGEHIDVDLQLDLDTGGRIAATVSGIDFALGEILTGEMSITFGNEGISGVANINFADVNLGDFVQLTEGQLTIRLETDGTLSASGSVIGDIAEIGRITLSASMENGVLCGDLDLDPNENLTIPGVEGVVIQEGHATGEFSYGQGWEVEGTIGVLVRDWVQGDITVGFKSPENVFRLDGTLNQIGAYTVQPEDDGELTIDLTTGELHCVMEDSQLTLVEVKADWATTDFQGHIEGDFNVVEQKLNVTGTVNLVAEELAFEEAGITIKTLDAQVEIKDNLPYRISGNIGGVAKYENLDTFEFAGTDLEFIVPEAALSGTASVKLLRELKFGDEAGYNASVADGAEAELTLTNSRLTGVQGGLEFKVNKGETQIGEGSIEVTFNEEQQLNASATFELTKEDGLKVPEEDGPIILLPGGSMTVTVEGTALKSASVDDVNFEVRQAAGEGEGKFTGSFSGSYDFTTNMLDVDGNCSLDSEWTVVTGGNFDIVIKEGGHLEIGVVQSKLTKLDGEFNMEGAIKEQGRVPQIFLTGILEGHYNDETKVFGGQLDVRLVETIDILMGEGDADRLNLKEGAHVTAVVANNAPSNVSIDIDGEYHRGGELFAEGAIEGAKYDFDTGHLNGKGNFILHKGIDKSTEDGKWRFIVKEGASFDINVKNSSVHSMTADIEGEIHDSQGLLCDGHFKNGNIGVEELKFAGTLDMTLRRDLQFPRSGGDEGGATTNEAAASVIVKKDTSKISGTLTDNRLSEIGINVDCDVKLGGEVYGNGNANATWNVTDNLISAGGSITLTKDFVYGAEDPTLDPNDPMSLYVVKFAAGQGLDFAVVDNQLDEANVNLGCKLYKGQFAELLGEGNINGRYKLGETDGFNGSVTLNVIKDIDWTTTDRFQYFLQAGTYFKATVAQSAFGGAEGAFKLLMKDASSGEDSVSVDVGGSYTPGTGLNAKGSITVLNDIEIGGKDGYVFSIAKDSGGSATVAGLEVTELSGDLTINVHKGETHFAQGVFNINYALNEANPELTAEGKVELLSRVDVTPEGAGDWGFCINEGTGVSLGIQASSLDYIRGMLKATATYKNTDAIEGQVDVDYTHGDNPNFECHGKIEVINRIDLGVVKDEYTFYVEPGTGTHVDICANDLEGFGGEVHISMHDGAGKLINVDLDGTYTHADTNFTGKGSVTLARPIDVGKSDDGKYSAVIQPDVTGAFVTITNNNLDCIRGTMVVHGNDPQGHFLTFTGDVRYERRDSKGYVSTASAKLQVANPRELFNSGGWTGTLSTDTFCEIIVTDNAPVKLNGELAVDIWKGEAFGCQLELAGWWTDKDGFNGSGRAKLLREYEIGGFGDYTFFITKDTTDVHLIVENTAVTRVGATCGFAVRENNEPFIEGHATVDYVFDEKLIESVGVGKLMVDKCLVDNVGGFSLYICEGSGANFLAQNDQLKTIGGLILMRVDEGGKIFADGKVQAEFDVQQGVFAGEGLITLQRRLGVGPHGEEGGKDIEGWGVCIKEGSNLLVKVADNAFQSAEITVFLAAFRNNQEVASGSLKGAYTPGQETYFSGTAEAKLDVAVPLFEDKDTGKWGFEIGNEKTKFSATVTNGELTAADGSFELNVLNSEKDNEKFANVTVSGSYSPETGVNGHGEASLLVEYEIHKATIGKDTYTLFALPGTGAFMDVANLQIKTVGGTINAMIRDGEDDFISISATAEWDVPGEKFGASGSASICKDKQLAELAKQQLWLCEGTGATVTVVDNDLETVRGSVKCALADEEIGRYVECGLENAIFDAKGGTGFSGTGFATVIKDKKLGPKIGKYQFVLAEGSGATATITENALSEVGGKVNFKILDDDPEPLLVGKAKGKYVVEEGLFNGDGDVKLGRDVTYELGDDGSKLVFKKGSGGGGCVENNKLKSLTGQLTVEIHDSQGKFVTCSANGEYDAVKNEIVRLEGTVTLERDIYVGGESLDDCILAITTLSGTAVVEHNELTSLSGKLGVEIPAINAKGHFEGGWEKGPGKDIFWGTGKVHVVIFEDPAEGRSLEGEIEGTYNKDETFELTGQIHYDLNEMIGGTIGVKVDQEMDPEIFGELRVKDVELMPERELIKFAQQMTLFKTTVMAGPVPIPMGAGVGFGISVLMQALTFSTTIGISGWRPLSAATKVPDFHCRADLKTGLTLIASLKPWFSISVGIQGIAEAGVKLLGEVALQVDANLNPYAELTGKGGEYFGELGINAGIVGSGFLALTPQLYAMLLGKEWPYSIKEFKHDLGELFSFEYNYAFPFGDNPGAPVEGGGGAGSKVAANATTTPTAGLEEATPPDSRTQGAAKRPAAKKGQPDANKVPEEDGKDSEGPMDELKAKMEDAKEKGAMIGRIAKVGGELVSVLMFMVTIPFPFGVAVAGAYLAYKLISGSLTIEEIQQACTDIWTLIQEINPGGITALLPEWLVNLWNKIKGKSLDDLLKMMVETMAATLKDWFPSAGKLIDALADLAIGIIDTTARVIRALISGSFSLDDFLDLCREVSELAWIVVEMVGEAVVEFVEDVGAAISDAWDSVCSW